MDTPSLLMFLGLVALGSYIQTVSGFAIAMIVTGGATALGLAPVAFSANVVSFLALANTAVAVHRQHAHVDIRILVYASLGVFTVVGIGLAILHHLSNQSIDLLEMLLGIVILGSGALLMIHPHPLPKVSPNYVHFIAGGFAGLLSGLFGAGGPPLVIHLYRQPLAFAVVRTTLLAILGIMPLTRIAIETYNGNISGLVLQLSLISIPITVIATIIARRFPPPVSDQTMRRFAFALLCVLGVSLIVGKL
ncbi:MAG: sulfite exporter TauE/SafE family protein [Chromatiaceae bacterium]|nr:sulfite exporter TauE/SafE family protein [Gammaproteobacteria bacterium]MCP5312938.1 sulfite exporter TauE/SafE family protein [Chromatiaceae bacterium]